MNGRRTRAICAATLIVVVFPFLLGCLPLNLVNPNYDFDPRTRGYSFETPREPAVVYRALLTVVEDDGGKIESRFDEELRMTVSYPPDGFLWLRGGVMTIECAHTTTGAKCLFTPPPEDRSRPFTNAVEPIVHDLRNALP